MIKILVPELGVILSVLSLWFGYSEHADAAELQKLTGHIPAAMNRLQPLRRMGPTQMMDLVIALPLRNSDNLQRQLREIYDPASPNFHHFLTPREFVTAYSPADADYQALITFAQNNHLTVVLQHSNRALLHVRAAVSDVEKAFHAKMNVYRHPTENREFFAPDSEPSLDLKVPVLHVAGMTNFDLPRLRQPPPPCFKIEASPNPPAGPPPGAMLGKDFRNAYAPNAVWDGTGQVVGILQLGGYFDEDISAYETAAGLPNVPIKHVYLNGYSGKGTTDLNNLETIESPMDIEMVVSMAPGLSQVTIYGADSNASTDDLLNEMANPTQGEPLPLQITTSYAIFYDKVVYQALQQMAAQGQSFFAYSGDNGAYADDSTGSPLPFPPGDYTYVTCVGGTILTANDHGAWKSEATWGGSGGGPSPWFPIPDWQKGMSNSTNRMSTTMRSCPDVAMPAVNIAVRCANGTWLVSGGTSASTPLWAGFMALINQRAQEVCGHSVGFINPAVYAIGQGSHYHECFHDITTGNNTSSNDPSKYAAIAGYDQCTGWGTPTGPALIDALASYGRPAEDLGGVALATSPAAVVRGQNIDVFYAGPNHHLTTSFWRGGPWWSAPADLGGVELNSAPSVASRNANRMDVFYCGPNKHLWTSWWDGGQWWSAPNDLGGVELTSAPSAVARTPTHIDVFYRGPNKHLWTSYWDSGQWWSAPIDLGGIELTSAPAAVSRLPNRIDVYYRGPNNHLWTSWWDGGQWWSAPTDLGGVELGDAPGAVAINDKRISVYYLGPSARLWSSYWNGGPWWSAPLDFKDVSISMAPAAVVPAGGGLRVFYRGSNDHLWMLSRN